MIPAACDLREILEWGGRHASPRDEDFLREGGGRLRFLSSVCLSVCVCSGPLATELGKKPGRETLFENPSKVLHLNLERQAHSEIEFSKRVSRPGFLPNSVASRPEHTHRHTEDRIPRRPPPSRRKFSSRDGLAAPHSNNNSIK